MQRGTTYSWDGFIVGLVFLLANLRALIFFFLFPDISVLLGPAWIEIFLWLILALAAFLVLKRENQFEEYSRLWKRNPLLILFVVLAFVSAAWSLGLTVTLFRALEFLFATLLAAYIGFRHRPERLMEALFWFGAILFILSIALAFGAPKTGTMYWAPFNGVWRGVYWHRNHLASITALLSAIYLCRMFVAFENRNSKAVLDGFFYLISLAVLYFARSATGYIVFMVLNGFVLCAWIWLKISHRLQRWHYIATFGIAALTLILVLTNLNFVFGLFNRTSALSGRTPLWNYLLSGVVVQHPWLGHGFGAFWTIEALRVDVMQKAAWTSQPLIGDNGFLDILIHLGIIGLLLFLGILIVAGVRSVRFAITQKTLPAFFPLLVMLYAFFGNLSFSLFAETEVFVWFLIAAVLFMTTSSSSRPAA